jgi:hypothetical protein
VAGRRSHWSPRRGMSRCSLHRGRSDSGWCVTATSNCRLPGTPSPPRSSGCRCFSPPRSAQIRFYSLASMSGAASQPELGLVRVSRAKRQPGSRQVDLPEDPPAGRIFLEEERSEGSGGRGAPRFVRGSPRYEAARAQSQGSTIRSRVRLPAASRACSVRARTSIVD